MEKTLRPAILLLAGRSVCVFYRFPFHTTFLGERKRGFFGHKEPPLALSLALFFLGQELFQAFLFQAVHQQEGGLQAFFVTQAVAPQEEQKQAVALGF